MKKSILFIFTLSLPVMGVLLPFTVRAAEVTKDSATVEMIEEKPSRPYSVITPLSSDKSSLEDAYADLRKKAAKLGADAVIEYQCNKGQKMRGGGVFGIGQKVTVKAGCEGKAVKWTGEPITPAPESKPIKKKHS